MDVAVVGAGPAGAWAAERLARGGARVTMFDPSHPREKPCGGGVTGRALALVADAVNATSFPRTVVRSARFIRSPKGSRSSYLEREASAERPESAVVPLGDASLVVASRAAFDAAILDAALRAGAMLERARVRDVAIAADGVRLETDAGPRRAAFVIGADGANGIVRRRVARPFTRSQLSIATGVFARGVTSAEIVIEFDADPPGYFWSFPRPDHLAIGVCAAADAGVGSGELRDRAMAWTTRGSLAEGAPLQAYAWPIPTLDRADFDGLRIAGARWALAGDAAGLVDPITREGIYFALASGGWLAAALLDDRPSAYDQRVRDEAFAELRRAARVKAAFFRPAFTGLLVAALRQSAPVRSVMADLIAGRQSYRTLKWRLLGTCEWGLAARALREALG